MRAASANPGAKMRLVAPLLRLRLETRALEAACLAYAAMRPSNRPSRRQKVAQTTIAILTHKLGAQLCRPLPPR